MKTVQDLQKALKFLNKGLELKEVAIYDETKVYHFLLNDKFLTSLTIRNHGLTEMEFDMILENMGEVYGI